MDEEVKLLLSRNELCLELERIDCYNIISTIVHLGERNLVQKEQKMLTNET